jgi:hypothetical protein
MNSLYGRFGLNPILNNNIIINKDELDEFVDTSVINEIIDFDDKLLVGLIHKDKISNNLQETFAQEIKSNVAIASSITAYSRMVLSNIKKYCLDNDIN